MSPAELARADQELAYLRDQLPTLLQLARVALQDAQDLRALNRPPTVDELARFGGARLLQLRAYLMRMQGALRTLGTDDELQRLAASMLAALGQVEAGLLAAERQGGGQ